MQMANIKKDPTRSPSHTSSMMASASAAHIVEVSAGASPGDVVSAIVSSATKETRASNPNRWIMLGFVFIFVFAGIVYFREEIYTISKDIHKHPILSVVETLQVRQYLGSRWTFGTGDDKVVDTIPILPNPAPSNTTAPKGLL